MKVGDQVTPGAVLVMAADDMRADRQGWLQLRRRRAGVGYCIGSSDAASILGIKFGADRAATPVRLWMEKVKGLETPDNAAMLWGRLHEDTIATYWRQRNRSVTEDVGLISAVEKPWHQTSLDRLVHECPLDRGTKERCALEIKTRNAFGMRKWHAELPDDVLAQICHQLYVSGFDHIHFACLIGGNDYKQGVVRRADEQAVIDHVIRECDDFRAKYLQEGNEVEPPWTDGMPAQSYIELDALKYPDRVGDAEIEDIGEVIAYAELRAKANKYARLLKTEKARLLRTAQGKRWLHFAGEPAFEMSPRSRIHIDQERLAEQYPEAWAAVAETRTYWQLDLSPAYKIKEPDESD